VINVGPKKTEATLRKALAVGADKAIRVDAETKDASFVAFQLAEAIKDQNFDLIMCGIESSDYNGSLVGGMLAELLDYTSVSSVSQVDIEGEDIHIVREIDGGKEKIKAQKPFVAIVQKGIAIEPKIPSMRGIMMARQKPLEVIPGVQTDSYCQDLNFELPAPKAACRIIDPENVQELVHLLHNEAKVI
jgi:electron transfer flavoprotein beta subunit